MTDDTAQSAPTPIESESPPEAATPTPIEPAPLPEPTPVVEQAASTEPASIILEESQSAPNIKDDSRQMSQPPSTLQPSTTPSSTATQGHSWSAAERAKAVATHTRKKEARLAKVVELAKEKGRIANDDIEKLLHVSDATASRYGTILVQRGLLRREGKGRSVAYFSV